MKNRILLLALVIIFLILALTGCRIIPPCCTEEMRAEQEVFSYWKAIINRQYELAKCFCIIGGIWDNKVDEWEEYINANSEGEASLMIYGPSFYEQTKVIGNNAIAYIWIFAHKISFPGSCIEEVDTFEYEVELIKETSPPGDWKLR